MQSLALSMRANRNTGLPLPPVFKGLENVGAYFRRGQTSLVVAAPGGGKSALATEHAIFMDYNGEGFMVPTMYFSADSDESTLGDRATAAIVRKDTTTVHNLLKNDDPDTWAAQEAATSHMWVNFNSSPTVEDIYNEVEAYCYTTGEFPHYIVIDNIMNINAGGGGTGMGMDNLYNAMEAFHALARETSAHVMVLHHATGDFTNGDSIIPRSGIMGKIDKVPRLILTLYKPEENVMGICVVKNSNGPADATGQEVQIQVPWMPASSWFSGTTRGQ